MCKKTNVKLKLVFNQNMWGGVNNQTFPWHNMIQT